MALYFHFTTTLPCYMCDDSILYWSKDGTGSYQSDGVTKVYLFFIHDINTMFSKNVYTNLP